MRQNENRTPTGYSRIYERVNGVSVLKEETPIYWGKGINIEIISRREDVRK